MLGTRWFSDLFLGAAMGALADLVGRIRLSLVLVFLLCLGLTLMLTVQNNMSFVALLAVLIVSTGVNVVLDAYANQAALMTHHPQMFVATYATASDLGLRGGPAVCVLAGCVLGIRDGLRDRRAAGRTDSLVPGHARRALRQAAGASVLRSVSNLPAVCAAVQR